MTHYLPPIRDDIPLNETHDREEDADAARRYWQITLERVDMDRIFMVVIRYVELGPQSWTYGIYLHPLTTDESTLLRAAAALLKHTRG